jgi:hypothetical protein
LSEQGRALRVASDTLLDDLDALAALEEEKRGVDPDDPRIVDLSRRIEALAQRVLEGTTEQRRLTVEINRAARSGTKPDDRPIEATPRTVSAVLDAWRAAERELAGTVDGTPEADIARAKVARLRDEYRRAYEARERKDR